jgi:hypothetical protein
MKTKIITITKGLILLLVVAVSKEAYAATLNLSPATGVYSAGSTFTVSVVVNTAGQSVNAADGTLGFNPKELSVVAVSRASSIFNLWTTEPAFSNAAGTVSFSGGSPTGYSGTVGTVMTVTFRTVAAGTPHITFSTGSVLAADGKGTNVLTSMGSGSYTISAQSTTPHEETIVEFVPQADTPAAPKVTSTTHDDQNAWYKETTAMLAWSLPADVTAVRTSLDTNKSSVPTHVYDTPIKSISLKDLSIGESYFHVQFKNKDGWGKVAHYRLAIDTTAPEGIVLSLADGTNLANPDQTIVVTTTDTVGAPLRTFKVQVDGGEPQEFANIDNKKQFTIKALKPGYHTLTATVFDEAGNSSVANLTFTTESFAAPVFTDVPALISTNVIPVLTGTTRANASVEATLTTTGQSPQTYTTHADEKGVFHIIPNGHLAEGVYTITAVATDEYKAQSAVSATYTMAVQPSDLIRVGSFLISVLSVIIPLIALVVLGAFGMWYLWYYTRRFRKAVHIEAVEVQHKLKEQFSHIHTVLDQEEEHLLTSRKTKKLTSAEANLFNQVRAALDEAERRVEKEADDVTTLTD